MFNLKMKKTKKGLAAITVCMLAVVFAACGKEEAEKKQPFVKYVKVQKIKARSGVKTLTYPGMSQAVQEIKLAFRVGGPLVQLPVDTGQYVEKGGLIAEIDPRDFQVNVKTVDAQLKVYQSKLEEAELQYHRYKNLYQQQAAEKAVYDRVKAGYESLKAQVEATAEKLQTAKNALTDTRLLAPFSGYVDTKYVENFDNVQAKTPIVSFLDCSSIEVITGVPEELLAEGIEFTGFACTFDAYADKTFAADLKELGKKPYVSNQTYPLTVILKASAAKLIRPGMAAEVKLTFKNSRNKLLVCIPNESLVSQNKDENHVFIYDHQRGTVKKQRVIPGKLISNGVEIINGLNPGQVIVTAGAGFLKDGQKVKPLPDASGRF